MDSNKNSANIGGEKIEIVKNSKFKGVTPSKEMGLDIEPTATKPKNMGSTSDIEPTAENPSLSSTTDIGPTGSTAGLGKQLRDPRDFPVDE